MTIWAPDIESSDEPAYMALARHLARDIAAGRVRPGERLPPQRDLARALGLSLGTVTRAYDLARRRGLIEAVVGRGTFVRQPGKEDLAPRPVPGPGPGLIDLSVNYPIHGEDPDLALTLEQISRRPWAGDLLRYQCARTERRSLEAGARWLMESGVPVVDPDGLLLTAGAQHAIMVILSTMTSPGDLLLAEQVTYSGLFPVAAQCGLRLHGVRQDEEGLLPDALEAACRHHRARFLYCMPTLHNPTAGVLSADRRARISEIAARHDLLIIEDDVHRPLLVDAPPSLSSLAPERTVFIASTSKVVSPGLRVAFVSPPPAAREALRLGVANSLMTVAPLNVEIVTTWIEDGTAARVTARKRKEARARQTLAREALSEHSYQGHPQAYFLWLRLPAHWKAAEFAVAARRRGVAVTPAAAFAAEGSAAPNAIRICLGAAESRGQLDRALRMLVDQLRAETGRGGPLV